MRWECLPFPVHGGSCLDTTRRHLVLGDNNGSLSIYSTETRKLLKLIPGSEAVTAVKIRYGFPLPFSNTLLASIFD